MIRPILLIIEQVESSIEAMSVLGEVRNIDLSLRRVIENGIGMAQMISLRALNDFFMLPAERKKFRKPCRKGDVYADHYEGYSGKGGFLKPDDEDSIMLNHIPVELADKGIAHITTYQLVIRNVFITPTLDAAADRSYDFLVFLRDSFLYPEDEPLPAVTALASKMDRKHQFSIK